MNADKTKRRQSLKVITSEAVMVIAVILMVTVLAFIVSGYWVNSDFTIERQGLLQVYSVPTGATITIDGDSSWLQKTNTSKVLSSGEHSVTLSKEGYDTWSKNVNITEGLLYRLNYPRLFLLDRKVEKALDLATVTGIYYSPNREKMLLTNGTTRWSIVNLTNETLTPEKYDISSFAPAVSVADGASVGLFSGEILSLNWDKSNSHALMKISTGDSIEWVLADFKNATNSINLTKSFGFNFNSIKIIDDSSSTLLAVENQNLHKIDVPSRVVSSVLVSSIYDYDYYDNEVVFSNQKDEIYQIGLYSLGNDKPTILETTATPVKLRISRFYDDTYIFVFANQKLSIYQKDDFAPYANFELSFEPASIKVGPNGDFLLFHSGNSLATVDMESSSLTEWQIENPDFGWLDGYMIYTVADGELIVYDYDSLNRRVLSSKASSRFPVTITSDKWLYYYSDGNLIREWLIPR